MQLHEDDCLVSVEGSGSESTFVREVIRSRFGGLCVPFRDLHQFLSCDPRLQLLFDHVESEPLRARLDDKQQAFSSLPLGQKLVASGLFEADMLSELLDEYSQFNLFDRFGDFLSIRSFCPSIVIDFLVNPSFIADADFNSMFLEDRLFILDLIDADVRETLRGMRSALDGSFSPFDYLHASTGLSHRALYFFENLQLIDGRCVPG